MPNSLVLTGEDASFMIFPNILLHDNAIHLSIVAFIDICEQILSLPTSVKRYLIKLEEKPL